MTKKTFIPSDDVYTYEKQALDMLPKSHPHYSEVYKHLYNQIREQLDDICYDTQARATELRICKYIWYSLVTNFVATCG